MNQSLRRAAVGIPGFCAFFNLYGPQSLLPSLARDFDASPAQVSLAITATTLAIALSAPFAGALADMLGRKRVIAAAMLVATVPLVMIALAPSLHVLVLWRFVLGLVLPPIFTVVVAYIGEEWPPAQATGAMGVYMAATGVGGFAGRLVSGLLADLVGWRSGFLITAALTFASGLAVAVILPRERNFTRSEGIVASGRAMLGHLRNPQLLATYAVGFGTLFTFVALFTYVNFLLAAPPFNLTPTLLGSIFVTYLAGSFTVLWLGRAIARFGRRTMVLAAIVTWCTGALLTLVPSLPVIILALAIAACGGFIVQATSTAYVALTAESGRTSAIGFYATTYYIGGSVGAVLPGLTWSLGGWPACVAMVLVVQACMAIVILVAWRR
ncbi:MAG: MFS transporter [Alphaproteobacteria bacterium]|nr:MFS transporter [Alphaproteobacteria bacterium]